MRRMACFSLGELDASKASIREYVRQEESGGQGLHQSQGLVEQSASDEQAVSSGLDVRQTSDVGGRDDLRRIRLDAVTLFARAS